MTDSTEDGLLRQWAYWVIGDDQQSMGNNILGDMVDTSDRTRNALFRKDKPIDVGGTGPLQSRANATATYKASYTSMMHATTSRRSNGSRVLLSDREKINDGNSSRCNELNQLLTSRMGHKSLKNVILAIMNPQHSIRHIAAALKIPPSTLQSQITKARKLSAMQP